jgi:flagellar assembly factor FliW
MLKKAHSNSWPSACTTTARMTSIQACRKALETDSADVVLYFPQGLPGFENRQRFIVNEPPSLTPFVCLRSVESPELCLWAAPVHVLDPGYWLEISPEDLAVLGWTKKSAPVDGPVDGPVHGKDVLCLAIVCRSQAGFFTANLLAPVVINVKTRMAVQAVRSDNRYSHRHPIGTTHRGEVAC